jgi:hypothetical protein
MLNKNIAVNEYLIIRKAGLHKKQFIPLKQAQATFK